MDMDKTSKLSGGVESVYIGILAVAWVIALPCLSVSVAIWSVKWLISLLSGLV